MELVSIIIPTYKRSKIVMNAIKSAINQTYSNIEIIVVQGNFEKFTDKNLKEFSEKIVIVKDKENIGVAHARNLGLNSSHGEYITFLDDDDVFHPKKIESQMKIFRKNKELGLVYCPKANFSNNKLVYNPLSYENNYWHGIRFKNPITMTPLIKTECFLTCGKFDEHLSYHEDRDMWYRIGKKYNFGFTNFPGYIFYNYNIERLSNQLNKICKSKKRLYDKHKKDFQNKKNIFLN